MSTEQSDEKGDNDICHIKNIFGESHAFAGKLACHIDESITGVCDNLHIYGHGSADTRADNGEKKDDKLLPEVLRLQIQYSGKQVHKTCKYNTEWNLQQICPTPVFAPDDQLQDREQTVKKECDIAYIPVSNSCNTKRYCNDRRYAKTGF